jgi:hypothetical protein
MNQRAKLAALVVLGAFIVVALAMPASSEEEKIPRLYIYNTAVELGEFIEGTDIVYQFEVRNRGLGELNIIDVKPG